MNTISTQYPELFNVLKQEVRKKAIEIANLLMQEGLKPEQAYNIAASNAFCGNLESANTDIHLISHPVGWALISADAIIFHFICNSRNEALGRARNKAKCEKLKLYIHDKDGIIIDAESFKVNRPLPLHLQQPHKEENVWPVKAEEEGRAYVFRSKREGNRTAAKRAVPKLFNETGLPEQIIF